MYHLFFSLTHSASPIPTPQNPELQARLDKIAADNQNKEYARMVKSIVGSEQDKLAFKIPHDEMQEIRGHVTAIMNVLFSIIACFGAFFKMSSVLTSETGSVRPSDRHSLVQRKMS